MVANVPLSNVTGGNANNEVGESIETDAADVELVAASLPELGDSWLMEPIARVRELPVSIAVPLGTEKEGERVVAGLERSVDEDMPWVMLVLLGRVEANADGLRSEIDPALELPLCSTEASGPDPCVMTLL